MLNTNAEHLLSGRGLATASPDMLELATMHTYGRPAGSMTERLFIQRFIAPLPGIEEDQFGNWMVRIGEAPVVWSCHTDTAHWTPVRQRVRLSGDHCLAVHRREKKRSREPLGADDTVGVWLCMEMIRAGRPGLYLFHFGEETGCVGSRHLAAATPERLTGIQAAIALDRRGRDEIITHQMGQQTASVGFAQSLARELRRGGLSYVPSDRGLYTDTFEYADLVPDCSNLSVGYFEQHTPDEWVDLRHVIRLRDALLGVDVSQLDFAPTPHVIHAIPASLDSRYSSFCRLCDRWVDPRDRRSDELCDFCSSISPSTTTTTVHPPALWECEWCKHFNYDAWTCANCRQRWNEDCETLYDIEPTSLN